MPGFPIRKPPDHSLAAGSPGHIAGSSVLHRLLVPRHPPCALKNLAQLLMHYTQQLRRAPPQRGRAQDRCSRPLCSSQETPRASPPPRPPGRGGNGQAAGPREETPPAGAGSLRTQQRAQPHPPREPAFRPRRAVLTRSRAQARLNSQRSTGKHWAPCRTLAGRGAWCSLERR